MYYRVYNTHTHIQYIYTYTIHIHIFNTHTHLQYTYTYPFTRENPVKIFQFYCMHTDCVNQLNFWWHMILYRVLYFSFPQAWFLYRLETMHPPAHSVTYFVPKNTIKWPVYKETVDRNVECVIQLAIANKLYFAGGCKPKTQNYCLHQCQWKEQSGLKYEILNTASFATFQTEGRTEDLLRNRH